MSKFEIAWTMWNPSVSLDELPYYFSGYYTIKEMVQTVNLALKGSVGALPTYPTIFGIS